MTIAETERMLVDEYTARTPASRSYHDQLRRYLPGGNTRSVAHYDPYPILLTEGEGALVRDVDGNEYVDVLNNYTALVHGHRSPALVEAARAALAGGTVFPAPHPSQLELARLLCERYPAVERVRFTNSGSEAALLAVRIARAATGRRRVIMFEGGYHGSVPEFIDDDADTVRLPYNDADAAAAAADSSIAAVFAEPFLGSGGVIPARDGFLLDVQAHARSVGALFVLDEVQGLRNGFHGMHDALGLQPDLVLMGKIIGGGFPVGAVGGRAELLDLTAAALPHSGTFNGNLVTMAAGLAGLQMLDEAAIAVLNERAASLAEDIEAAAVRTGVPACVTRSGSILHVHLTPEHPLRAAGETAIARQLHLALLLEGIYTAPRGMLNLSTAVTDADSSRVRTGYEAALRRIQGLVSASDQRTGAM